MAVRRHFCNGWGYQVILLWWQMGSWEKGFWLMNYWASCNHGNSKTRQGQELIPMLRCTWPPTGQGSMLILAFSPVLQVLAT